MREARGEDRRAGSRGRPLARRSRPSSQPTACSSSDATSRSGPRRRSGSRRSRSRSPRRSALRRTGSTSGHCALLSHTAGLRCESVQPLPQEAIGLWSYSNAGYWEAAASCGAPFDTRWRRTSSSRSASRRPDSRSRSRLPRTRAGRRVRAPRSQRRQLSRRSLAVGRPVVDGGGSAALRGAPSRRRSRRALHEPRVARARRALCARLVGARARRRQDDARPRRLGRRLPVAALARARRVARARGADEQLARKRTRPPRRRVASAARRIRLGGGPASCASRRRPEPYELDGAEASVEATADGVVVSEAETDPVTGTRRSTRYPARADRRRCLRLRARDAHEPPARLSATGAGADRLGRAAARRRSERAAGVAAGHPATADAGAEILADGGYAADAAVAAALASCVAETVMTGLLGGGHAIYFDAASGRARNLDCFCADAGARAPTARRRARPPGGAVRRRARPLRSRAGVVCRAGRARGARAAVGGARAPAVAAARRARAAARPGRRRDAAGARRVPRDARAGDDAARGRAHLCAGRDDCCAPASGSSSPASSRRSSRSQPRAPRARTPGRSRASLLALSDERGGLLTADDLRAYEAALERAGARRRGSAGASSPAAGSRASRAARTPAAPRGALGGRPRRRARRGARRRAGPETHTTNLVTVDSDGNACVLTTSLGLGSGDWLPGLDLHLNSMLGEADLVLGPLEPGRAHGEHDGAVSSCSTTRASCWRSARPAARGCAPRSSRSRRGSSTRASSRRRPSTRPRVHPAGERRERRAGRRRGRARGARGGRAHRAPLGGSVTTISAASARWDGAEPRPTRAGAERRAFGRRVSGIQPT